MSDIAKKPVKITETILRDAHQSLIATRMPTEEMLPILEKLDKVGYHSLECWGGATFDASLRFLKEDPWERLRKIRDGVKNTKLQMLFRGQNILGYRPYADDVVEYFVQKSIANGIDIIRIFDCLNDLRNLQATVDATNKNDIYTVNADSSSVTSSTGALAVTKGSKDANNNTAYDVDLSAATKTNIQKGVDAKTASKTELVDALRNI